MRLLLPTEEFPIRSSLQLVTEFVATIDGDEEMVVGRTRHPWLRPAPSLGFVADTWRSARMGNPLPDQIHRGPTFPESEDPLASVCLQSLSGSTAITCCQS